MIGWHDVSRFYFVWPWAFALLALIPVWWVLYANYRRRQIERQALAFSYTSVATQLKLQPAMWKRLFMPGSVSLLMLCLVTALARPTVVASLPVSSVDMMLVMDISLSMLAEDMKPDRITAAKNAAVQFVDSLPQDVRVGLEVFAGDNYVLSPPTSRHDEMIAYLKALQRDDLKPRTEIGSAMHTALKILSDSEEAKPEEANAEKEPKRPPGDRKPERVIVLLSDGDSHEGYPWDLAARDALTANVTVHTVGIGSAAGTTIMYPGMELPVTFDETTLREIANIAHGSYFRVFAEKDFRKVYRQIRDRTVHYEEQTVDLAFIAAGLGLLSLFGAGLLAWFI